MAQQSVAVDELPFGGNDLKSLAARRHASRTVLTWGIRQCFGTLYLDMLPR
jgi:hypothetical protein